MDRIIIGGIKMPKTKTFQVGGVDEAKTATMASGKIVQDIIGFRKELTATWEWIPASVLTAIVEMARAGGFVEIQYPDPLEARASGMFQIEIGSQKIFKFVCGAPRWYNIELKATAQEVE